MTATASLPAECVVACPSCGADDDQLCRTKDGRPNRNPHNARRKAWQEWITAKLDARDAAAAPAVPVKDTLALQLAVLKVLMARVETVNADLRAQAAHALAVSDAVPAYLSDADRRTGANKIGRLGLSKPRESWKIKDPDAFTAWVLKHHPEEIETRPVVRNGFVTAVMAKHKQAGCWIGPGGEAVEVPGIELDLGNPVLSVTLTDEAEALVALAMAEGRIRFDGEHLAITDGTEA